MKMRADITMMSREKGLLAISSVSLEMLNDLLFKKVWYQTQARNNQKRRKRYPVEESKDNQQSKYACRKWRCALCNVSVTESSFSSGRPTLLSTILCIKTRLQATSKVSIEFENVCI